MWREFKSKTGLIQEIFTGISFEEKQFGSPQVNKNSKNVEGGRNDAIFKTKGEPTKGKVRGAAMGRDERQAFAQFWC